MSYDSGEITDREKLAAKRQKSLSKYNENTLKGSTKYGKNTAKNLAAWNSDLQNDIATGDAKRTAEIAEYNADNTLGQLNRQTENYDFANQQNASLRDVEATQDRRKAETDRFEAQRQLQNSALGLFGDMNTAMNGSTTGNTMRMLENRNDSENNVYWQALQDNLNALQNAYDESYNQNNIAKRDAAINAIKSIQDIEGDLSANLGNIQGNLFANLGNIRGDLLANLANIEGDYYANKRNLRGDLAANLNNINPNLYEAPENIKIPSGYDIPDGLGRIGAMQNAKGQSKNPIYQSPGKNKALKAAEKNAKKTLKGIKKNNATLLDYLMPENSGYNVQRQRNKIGGNDYFSRLVNGFND